MGLQPPIVVGTMIGFVYDPLRPNKVLAMRALFLQLSLLPSSWNGQKQNTRSRVVTALLPRYGRSRASSRLLQAPYGMVCLTRNLVVSRLPQ